MAERETCDCGGKLIVNSSYDVVLSYVKGGRRDTNEARLEILNLIAQGRENKTTADDLGTHSRRVGTSAVRNLMGGKDLPIKERHRDGVSIRHADVEPSTP